MGMQKAREYIEAEKAKVEAQRIALREKLQELDSEFTLLSAVEAKLEAPDGGE